MLAIESAVPMDTRPCPFCDQPIREHAVLAIMPTGELRWADALCAVKSNGRGRSLMIPDARVQ